MLKNVGAKLTDELSVLVIDLYLVCWRSFGNDYVTRLFDNSHSIRVEQLSVSFATFAELELEASLFIEDLNAVVVSVGHYNIVLRIHCNSCSDKSI